MRDLRNVGKATLKDLTLLGIASTEELCCALSEMVNLGRVKARIIGDLEFGLISLASAREISSKARGLIS